MPVLGESLVRKVYLPSTQGLPQDEQAWVEIDLHPTAAVAMQIDENSGNREATVALLASVIKGWNYTDSDGKPVPVTRENVAQLGIMDIAQLEAMIGKSKAQVGGIDTAEKKDSSATSSAPGAGKS